MSLTTPKRFAIIGVPGTGKTTFARKMARQFGLPHIELDEIYWGPNWQPISRELFHQRLQKIADQNRDWIIDGSFPEDRDVVWKTGVILVWLDYSLPRVFWQMVGRVLHRFLRHEPLYGGNRATLRTGMWDLIAPLKCRFLKGSHHRPTIEHFFNDPQFAHLERVRLLTPTDADAYLVSLQHELGIPSDTH
jgi:hypothetical protein